ncbi:hypothetical protein [Actinomadura roseirufa]|uniref:hypothetical protein n=1 Tax=Actinomadura roseirufa TaxID=2094049 RepID=UPI0010419E1A|nr:hypothetical protein [Actinomadura roseirufa]
MTDSDTDDFAEFGATILDSFQALFEQSTAWNHRRNDHQARELLADLLTDLMHYTDQRGLSFDDVLDGARSSFFSEQAQARALAIGSLVQLEGPAAHEAELLGHPTRGCVTGLLIPDSGPIEYYVHFMGDSKNQRILDTDLEPAPPFPLTSTSRGIIDNPLRAEEVIIQTVRQIERAKARGAHPQPEDVRDHQALLRALTGWSRMDPRTATDLIKARSTSTTRRPEEPSAPNTPPQAGPLAAQGFPVSLEQGLPDRSARTPSRPSSAPGKPPHRPRSR